MDDLKQNSAASTAASNNDSNKTQKDLRQRMMVLIGVFFTALLSLTGFGFVALEEDLADSDFAALIDTKDLIADILPPPHFIIEAYLVTLQMPGVTDEARLREQVARLRTLKTDYDTRHNFWKEHLAPGQLATAVLDDSNRPVQTFFDAVERDLIPAAQRGDNEAMAATVAGELTGLYEQHRQSTLRAVDLANTAAITTAKAAEDSIGRKKMVFVGVSVLFSALSAFLAWRIIETLRRSLTEQQKMQDALAVGMAASERTSGRLRDIMAKVAANASELAASSGHLTGISGDMNHDAKTSSAQAQNASAAAEQVSKSVESVTTAVGELNAAIKEIARSVSGAVEIANSAVGMAQDTDSKVRKLGDSSTDIGNVIKVITSIAEQTNLLALNATIEAARAGEAGKGFAVVANEVKELARETAKATDDISRKIDAIQADTGGAVDAIGQICTIIHQINEFQNSIASAVEEQTVMSVQIQRSLEEAARGSVGIAKSVTEVADAAESTSRGAERVRESAQQLSGTATTLLDIAGQVRTSSNGASDTSGVAANDAGPRMERVA
jgi:methyl-accepting chemotaxis protein